MKNMLGLIVAVCVIGIVLFTGCKSDSNTNDGFLSACSGVEDVSNAQTGTKSEPAASTEEAHSEEKADVEPSGEEKSESVDESESEENGTSADTEPEEKDNTKEVTTESSERTETKESTREMDTKKESEPEPTQTETESVPTETEPAVAADRNQYGIILDSKSPDEIVSLANSILSVYPIEGQYYTEYRDALPIRPIVFSEAGFIAGYATIVDSTTITHDYLMSSHVNNALTDWNHYVEYSPYAEGLYSILNINIMEESRANEIYNKLVALLSPRLLESKVEMNPQFDVVLVDGQWVHKITRYVITATKFKPLEGREN